MIVSTNMNLPTRTGLAQGFRLSSRSPFSCGMDWQSQLLHWRSCTPDLHVPSTSSHPHPPALPGCSLQWHHHAWASWTCRLSCCAWRRTVRVGQFREGTYSLCTVLGRLRWWGLAACVGLVRNLYLQCDLAWSSATGRLCVA